MGIKLILVILGVAILGTWRTSAEAAQQFTVAQINPAPGSPVVMGSTQLVTFRITNTNTGPNAGERIYYVRFQTNNACAAPCRNTTFNAGATAPPANWSKSTSSSTDIIFQPNTFANAIPAGGFQDFTLSVYTGSRTANFTETLRRVRVRYTTTAGGTCCPSTYVQTGGTRTINNPANLAVKSLSINSFQTTDCAGTPITSVTSGNNFCVVMTVQNFSSAAQNGIVTNPTNPPSGANISKTGTVTQNWISTTYAPNPLNLAAGAGPGYVGASGTITFRYSTVGTDNGTIQFVNLNARRSATVTSPPANSNILNVSRLTISIAISGPLPASPTCVFSGDTATFTMTVTNNTGAAVTNVTPSALTRFYPTGSPTIGAFTGPSPASYASIANGASQAFTWTATVTGTLGNPKSSFYVTGSVTYNGGVTSVTATSNTEDVDGYVVSLTPASTNASSTNEELQWAVTNYGCAKTQSVSIAGSVPAGWSWTGGDSYSLVGNGNLETWTVGGANPPVVFSAPAPADQLSILEAGTFSLVYPTTPTPAITPTTYTFNITITDANATPVVKTLPTTVTVNPFNTGSLNATGTDAVREDFR
jgi:hypothetical protein